MPTKRLLYAKHSFCLQGVGFMGDKKKILVVEDEPHRIKLISFILKSSGYDVIEAEISAAGLKKAKAEKPDMIILDVMMPKMDGFEVAKKLKADPATRNIPILMLSSKAQFEDKMKGIDSGATDYITKPFDREELLQKIEELLES